MADVMTPSAVDGLSVVMCVHTEQRLPLIQRGIAAVQDQLDPSRDELVIVVDHHPRLLDRLSTQYPHLLVVPNSAAAGLSGARNTGIGASAGAVIVFLDDDAVPRGGWIRGWREVFADAGIAMAGGQVLAAWDGGQAPRWFPEEYGWVVGCDYRGMPESGAAIRNPIGANMAVRRTAIDRAGAFSIALGRTGELPAGCEETEMGIRIGRLCGPGSIVRTTVPTVDHAVPATRQRLRYFVRRCYHEGRSKAALSASVGSADGLSSERAYVLRTLTAGARRYLSSVRADASGLARAALLVVGLGATTAGFAVGSVRNRSATDAAPGDQLPVPASTAARAAGLQAPVPILEVELAGSAGRPVPAGTGAASVLVRFRGLPVGTVLLRGEAPSRAAELDAALPELADALQHHLRRHAVTYGGDPADVVRAARSAACAGAGDQPWPQLVSVVICTLGRDARVVEAVRGVLAQTHVAVDLVVVDNDPASGALRRLIGRIDDPRLRIVDEPQRGLSYARNRGLSEARGSLVAYTDDDALPDPHWVAELARVFAADGSGRVGCVTGLVTPASLDTQYAILFEEYGAFDKGYVPRYWAIGDDTDLRPLAEPGRRGPLFPYIGGDYGSGNNMAFRTDLLRALGGFDPALGAGTRARGGEDLDIYSSVLLSGAGIVYTPTALVRHFHRDTEAALRSQLYGYGVGMSAAISKQLLSDPRIAAHMLRRAPSALQRLVGRSSVKNAGKSQQYPLSLTLLEWWGYLAGPVQLARSRARARRARSAQ